MILLRQATEHEATAPTSPLAPRRPGRRRRRGGRRGARSGAQLRRLHRRRPRELRGPARRGLRPARAERRRQDHHLPHAVRAAAGDQRHAARRRRRPAHARGPRPGSGSATWRRSSRSTGSCRVRENLDFFASAYGLRGAARSRAHRLGAGAVRAGAARALAERPACPAATSSGWRWRPRCCTSRTSCSSTSRPAAPIRSRAASSGGGSRRSPSRASR